MRKSVGAASLVACFVVGAVVAGEKQKVSQQKAEGTSSVKRQTIVYSARSTPVRELASTLAEFFEGSGVRAVADPVSNLLIIQTDAGSGDEVLGLLKKLDRPLRSIVVQAHLLKAHGKKLDELDTNAFTGPSDEVLKRIQDLERNGRLYVANRMELTAVENQQVMFQIGQRVPVLTGMMSSRLGTPAKSYRSENVGTLLSVQARCSEDGGITMEVNFEKSEVVDVEQKSDDKFVPTDTSTMTEQTTLQILDGHSVLVGSQSRRSHDQTEEVYLVVGAKIIDAREAAGRPVSFRSFSQRSPVRTARSLPSSPPSRATSGFRPSSSTDRKARYDAYSRAVFERYDSNKDSVLTADEWKSMPPGASEADADKDGKVNPDELTAWFLKRSTRSRGRPTPTRSNE